MAIPFIVLILAFSGFFLRVWIVGPDKEKISDDGNELNIKGKLILGLIGLISAIVIMIADGVQGIGMKWFWIVFIIIAVGFQSYIDWKFLKHTKQHIVSMILLVEGVVLVYFFF
ncbi:hypothetical protein R50345_19570 [Paenibacillus sp. FSL R5-0345]|uniref:DUF4181 domain-containing protein n=1 Tax=Paenibacillus sp. FSL R5-0345 TaxID=1536770 RepID=UPI0004F8E38B|nr:DUF4181 domain-containing protein [Paenibacillus sp. FSL R5-0345]AIQ36642.1 hypothetical protein R50345_19570 [Paenibacillus sp. FSL R5-0345]